MASTPLTAGGGSLRLERPTSAKRTRAERLRSNFELGAELQLTGASLVTLSIDGQVTPERIPDDVAYRHFISVTAVGSGAAAADFSRRDAILEQVGLSDADRRTYVAATTTVKDALQSIDHRLEAFHQDISAVDALKQERRSVLDNAAQRVLSSLSADGAARMRSHINERVKRRIRIYSQVQPLPGRDQ